MSKKRALLIAEKPDLMRDIRAAYNSMNFADEITFTSAVGHLLELKYPGEYNSEWQKWSLKTLPMIPEKFSHKVNVNTLRNFNIIKKEIQSGKYDYIINAGDPGREGQLIVRSLLTHLNWKLPVKRLWWNDLTIETFQKALNNMDDDNAPVRKAVEHAAILRAQFDWLIGMNFSRAMTIKTGATIPIGRVMTPILKILVDKENEVLNFVPQDFYETIAIFKEGYAGKWFHQETNGTRYRTEASAQALIDRISNCKTGAIFKLEKKRKRNHPYQLHNLSQLQIEANKSFGYTPTETLDIVQGLYETHKVLSYPRTDCRYITEAMAKDIPDQLKSFQGIEVYGEIIKSIFSDSNRVNRTLKDKRYVNDKKVGEHYAITPTTVVPEMNKFTQAERNIYLLVLRRFVSMFLDPELIDSTEIITEIGGEHFRTIGNVLADKGFTVLYNVNRKDINLPELSEGQLVNIEEFNIEIGKTTPPKRYDFSSIVAVMEDANRLIEKDNLKLEKLSMGTDATRGIVLDKLISNEMMEVKNKHLIPTEFGISIIQALDGRDITSAELTAEWEKKLREIESQNLKPQDFQNEMLSYISKTTSDIIKDINSDLSKFNKNKNKSQRSLEIIGECPICKKGAGIHSNGLSCEDNNCKFFVSNKILGVKISDTELKKIINGKETKAYSFPFKSGKKDNVTLSLKSNGQLSFNNKK